MSRLIHLALLASAGAGLAGACTPGQFITATIYETPSAYVRLEFDRTITKGTEHSHPISLTPDQIAAVLGGVRIDEPLAKLPLYDDTSLPRVHPAFTDKEIVFFAPLLALALSKATPEEVVTFYETHYHSATSREVTSGGVFVQGDELHLILANYRSQTHFMADPNMADTTDDRLTPMESLSPQRSRVDFDPPSARRSAHSSGLRRLFEWDRHELIVLYLQLAPRKFSAGPDLPLSIPVQK